MTKTKLGPLEVRVVGGDDGRGGGDGPVVVLMHGFGASGDDLVPLAQFLRVADGIRFVFPEAPLPLPEEMGGFGGRMWWDIDTEALARSMASGRPRDLRGDEPAGLSSAREMVVQMLHALRAAFGADAKLVLGGFSQGSMLACDVAFRTAEPLDGLVVLSGTHVAADAWGAGMPARAGLPVFQSHGTHDAMLPFGMAESLMAAMTSAGLRTSFHAFRGGHEIPMPILRELGTAIAAMVG